MIRGMGNECWPPRKMSTMGVAATIFQLNCELQSKSWRWSSKRPQAHNNQEWKNTERVKSSIGMKSNLWSTFKKQISSISFSIIAKCCFLCRDFIYKKTRKERKKRNQKAKDMSHKCHSCTKLMRNPGGWHDQHNVHKDEKQTSLTEVFYQTGYRWKADLYSVLC